MLFSVPLHAAAAIQLKIIEGDGASYRTGTRAATGVTVMVTDSAGQPVNQASVTFLLPDQGPSGVFNSGKRDQLVTTGPDGRATVWGMQWNKTAGPVEFRITAVKDQERAGIFVTQYLKDSSAFQSAALQSGAPQAGGQGVFSASHGGHGKWLLIGALVAGAAAAGIVVARSKSGSTAATPALSIGTPSIIIGSHP